MKLPMMSAMWNEYPNDHDKAAVARTIGGTVEVDVVKHGWDTCCIRTSRALNYGGTPVQGFSRMQNEYVPPKVRAIPGADKKWYIYSVYDMRVYLRNRFGHPRRFPSKTSSAVMATKNVHGVVMFFPHHCDLWDGTSVRYNDQLWEDPRVQELLLWESPE
jgi:hypothetical protein